MGWSTIRTPPTRGKSKSLIRNNSLFLGFTSAPKDDAHSQWGKHGSIYWTFTSTLQSPANPEKNQKWQSDLQGHGTEQVPWRPSPLFVQEEQDISQSWPPPLLQGVLLPAKPSILQHLVWILPATSEPALSKILRCILKKTRLVLQYSCKNLHFRGFTNCLLVNCSTFSEMYLNTVLTETFFLHTHEDTSCSTPLLQKPPINGVCNSPLSEL